MSSSNTLTTVALATLITGAFTSASYANTNHEQENLTPQSHAPIGVMGDHLHKKGEFMFSYRFMNMKMADNIQGHHNVSDSEIVTMANRFANMPMMPPTIRVVPKKMTTNMHMLGFMYAPSDDITLMAMVNYFEKYMTLTSYQGMMGIANPQNFKTESSGLGDTKLGMLYRLYDQGNHHVHLNVSWQIPTGDTNKIDSVLTPMGATMAMRLPYAMQLSTGSNIAELGATYNGYYADKVNWGAQVLYSTALENNDEHYKVGDKAVATAWYGQQLHENFSSSMRLTYTKVGAIDGIDNMIMAPVTTANPSNTGGEYIDFSFGINTIIANKHRIACEYKIPLEQDVNGVQMEMDKMLTLGYQISF